MDEKENAREGRIAVESPMLSTPGRSKTTPAAKRKPIKNRKYEKRKKRRPAFDLFSSPLQLRDRNRAAKCDAGDQKKSGQACSEGNVSKKKRLRALKQLCRRRGPRRVFSSNSKREVGTCPRWLAHSFSRFDSCVAGHETITRHQLEEMGPLRKPGGLPRQRRRVPATCGQKKKRWRL